LAKSSGEFEYRGQSRNLSGAVEWAEESGAWPGGSIFQNLADVEFGDGFPRDVAGNNLGVDVRLPAIAKDKPVADLVVENLEFLV
jgi:hypothetical protein